MAWLPFSALPLLSSIDSEDEEKAPLSPAASTAVLALSRSCARSRRIVSLSFRGGHGRSESGSSGVENRTALFHRRLHGFLVLDSPLSPPRSMTISHHFFALILSSSPTTPSPPPGPRLGRAAQGRRRRRPQQGQAGPRRRRPRPRSRRHGDAGLCRRLGPHPVLAVQAVRLAPEEGGQGPPEEAQAGAQ